MSGESKQADTVEVWLVSDDDDYRAMHDMIAIIDGERVTLFECTDWREQSPVEAVLAAAGFVGGGGAAVTVHVTRGADEGFVKLRGFVCEKDQLPEVELAIHQGLMGELGGFAPVVMGQVGFHRSVYAFEHVWAAAGRPPIRIRQPALLTGGAGSAESPAEIFAPATANPRLAAALTRFGELPKRGTTA